MNESWYGTSEWDHAIYLWQWMEPDVLQLKQCVGPEALLIDKNKWHQKIHSWE
jgi:hypothetical protein